MRRHPALVVLALTGGLVTAPATGAADSDPDVRSVRAVLSGDVIRLDVTLEQQIEGPEPAPGFVFGAPLPLQASITKAAVRVGARTHRLQLSEHADAERQLAILNELPTARGGRRSAVRIDADAESATFTVAVPQPMPLLFDLSLEVATCFADDARHILVPAAWANVVTGATRVAATELASLDARCHADSGDRVWLAIPVREQPPIAIRSARLPLGETDLARIEIALAKQLTHVPDDLHTVLVVDHSRSMTETDLEMQRAVVAAYLRAAPKSRVQVVGYARDARTLLSGWLVAGDATHAIDKALEALAPRNGSNVDRGLAAAATLLGSVRGTRRIVLLTDDRLAHRIETGVGSLAPALPAGILVHAVSVRGTDGRIARDDTHVLAPLARATKGIAVRADTDERGVLDAMSLVRPTSFDNVTISGPGWTALAESHECPLDDTFREGSSCSWIARGTPASRPITVEGYLWGTHVVREVAPDARNARSLARQLANAYGLPADLVAAVHRAARAVNSVWTLVGTWGPAGGYGDLMSSSYGTIGTGSYSSTTRCGPFGGGPGGGRSNLIAELTAQLAPGIRACQPRGEIGVVLEVTEQEIVDLSLTIHDEHDAANSALADCITDVVWDAHIALSQPPAHATFELAFAH